MTTIGGLLIGIGRSFRRKRSSSLDILSPKRAPRDFYKGKNCKPTGFHTRKGSNFHPRKLSIDSFLANTCFSLVDNCNLVLLVV
ncbi:putative ribosomal protein L27/L41 [Arabidopsis thaliana]